VSSTVIKPISIARTGDQAKRGRHRAPHHPARRVDFAAACAHARHEQYPELRSRPVFSRPRQARLYQASRIFLFLKSGNMARQKPVSSAGKTPLPVFRA
jgi:hypothetical protein